MWGSPSERGPAKVNEKSTLLPRKCQRGGGSRATFFGKASFSKSFGVESHFCVNSWSKRRCNSTLSHATLGND